MQESLGNYAYAIIVKFKYILNIQNFFWGGLSWPRSYGSWTYNYLSNHCLSPLLLWVRISIRERCITVCNKDGQWLAIGRYFSPGSPITSTNKTAHHDIAEILLKVALGNTKQSNNYLQYRTLYNHSSILYTILHSISVLLSCTISYSL